VKFDAFASWNPHLALSFANFFLRAAEGALFPVLFSKSSSKVSVVGFDDE
jgi:hypothetical protein